MSANLAVSKIVVTFSVECEESQTKNAIITTDKVTEIFCIADDLCKFSDIIMANIR